MNIETFENILKKDNTGQQLTTAIKWHEVSEDEMAELSDGHGSGSESD